MMPVLPDQIEQFLSRHLTAVDQLDLLVLLYNSPQTEWTADAAAQVVHCPVDKAKTYLDQLEQQGFLGASGAPDRRYRYQPQDETRGQEARAMVEFYRERPVSVIRRIYDQAQNPLRAFADAFKLKPLS